MCGKNMILVDSWLDPQSPYDIGATVWGWECQCGNSEPWQDPKLDEENIY